MRQKVAGEKREDDARTAEEKEEGALLTDKRSRTDIGALSGGSSKKFPAFSAERRDGVKGKSERRRPATHQGKEQGQDQGLNEPADGAHPHRPPGAFVVKGLPHRNYHCNQHPD